MRVLITGSKGFTGQYLLPELQRLGVQTEEFKGDLLDRSNIQTQLEQLCPDAIVHLAGISFVPDGNSIDVYQVNTLAVEQLLELASATKSVKRIILASSSAVYGKNTNPKESDCPAPINHYGISKLAMELISKNYQNNLNIIIARPFNYTGGKQSKNFLIPKLVWHFQQRKKQLELGNMKIARDFSDVRWVVKAYAALIGTPNVTGVYNLCSGEKHTLAEILEYLEKKYQHKPDYIINPDFVRENDILEQQGSNERLCAEFPSLKPYDFFQTLDWMSQ